jgi:hypothetical protein
MNDIFHTRDLTVIASILDELTSPDGCENFRPPLAFKLDIKEFVYSFESGTLNIK